MASKLLLPLLALVLGLAGCSSDKLKLVVTSDQEVNGGKPLYVVIRKIEAAAFVTDSYDTVAQKCFAQPPDPSVLRYDVIYPGVEAEFVVPKPDALPVAVYFLFSQPGDRWKMQKAQPLPNKIELELEKNEIKEGS